MDAVTVIYDKRGPVIDDFATSLANDFRPGQPVKGSVVERKPIGILFRGRIMRNTIIRIVLPLFREDPRDDS